jgi:hypothetical protein
MLKILLDCLRALMIPILYPVGSREGMIRFFCVGDKFLPLLHLPEFHQAAGPASSEIHIANFLEIPEIWARPLRKIGKPGIPARFQPNPDYSGSAADGDRLNNIRSVLMHNKTAKEGHS